MFSENNRIILDNNILIKIIKNKVLFSPLPHISLPLSLPLSLLLFPFLFLIFFFFPSFLPYFLFWESKISTIYTYAFFIKQNFRDKHCGAIVKSLLRIAVSHVKVPWVRVLPQIPIQHPRKQSMIAQVTWVWMEFQGPGFCVAPVPSVADIWWVK